jgi:hypothetical protein
MEETYADVVQLHFVIDRLVCGCDVREVGIVRCVLMKLKMLPRAPPRHKEKLGGSRRNLVPCRDFTPV